MIVILLPRTRLQPTKLHYRVVLCTVQREHSSSEKTSSGVNCTVASWTPACSRSCLQLIVNVPEVSSSCTIAHICDATLQSKNHLISTRAPEGRPRTAAEDGD